MAISIKTIAKNSVYLYIRMVITMLIALYSSRIVLHVLDVDGFGTYNVIYGIVVFFLFLQSSLNYNHFKVYIPRVLQHVQNQNRLRYLTLYYTLQIILIVVSIYSVRDFGGLYSDTCIEIIGEEYRDAIIPCFRYALSLLLFKLLEYHTHR